MNYYFLLEDEKSFLKYYQAGLSIWGLDMSELLIYRE